MEQVVSYTKERLADIENPLRALEEELARLIEAKTPPNGEHYKTRQDKFEPALAFFRRVYGHFYDAGVLRYRTQLRAMDPNFAHLLAQFKESVPLLIKREENDEALAKLSSPNEAMRLASVAFRRRQRTA